MRPLKAISANWIFDKLFLQIAWLMSLSLSNEFGVQEVRGEWAPETRKYREQVGNR